MFASLFGPLEDVENNHSETFPDEASLSSPSAKNAATEATQVANSKLESISWRQLRSQFGQPDFDRELFNRIFCDDVERLLFMKDLWKERTPPAPLRYESIASSPSGDSGSEPHNDAQREQTIWPLSDYLNLFKTGFDIWPGVIIP